MPGVRVIYGLYLLVNKLPWLNSVHVAEFSLGLTALLFNLKLPTSKRATTPFHHGV